MPTLKRTAKTLWARITSIPGKINLNPKDIEDTNLQPMDDETFFDFLALLNNTLEDQEERVSLITFIENVVSLTGFSKLDSRKVIHWDEFSVILGVFRIQQASIKNQPPPPVVPGNKFLNRKGSATELVESSLPSADNIKEILKGIEQIDHFSKQI
jgi:hypothetical protein